MDRKPTYEELELRIEELERKAFERKLSKKALQASEGFFDTLVSSVSNGVILRDVTTEKRSEEALQKTHDELEQRVKERTAELVLINENLQKEIIDRQHAEAKFIKSKAMFKAVVESLPFDVFVLDSDNRYILQNSICEKNWGNLMGKYPEDVPVNKNTKKLWLENNHRALSGETVTGEVVYDGLNGEKSFYYNIVAPIHHGEEIFGILGVIIDVSEVKRVEEAVRESRERFRNLTEMTSDWIWEVDENGCYTYASPKIYDILGYKTEEIIGKTPFDLMPTEEADRVFKIFNAIAAKQRPFDCIENINLHKNGRPVVLETSGVPTFDAKGKYTGYRGIDRDITFRKQSEQELQKAHDELENRVEERTRELIIQKSNLEEANIALHVLLDKRQEDKKEIEGNVLTNVKEIIMPYLKKMKKTKLDDQQKTFLNIIESNIYEIISPFTRKMSLRYLNLTPAEIHVANLIRHGRNSKEIAELMALSSRTIYNHRKNIRKKLGLENRKANLRSHLLSIY
jgi:PAS domain S-box-containing protein